MTSWEGRLVKILIKRRHSEEAAPKNVILHLTYVLKDSKQDQGY